ncbi:MAG: 2-C-methyl-D-erythritol 2,4-cyclodiphosphate synthase [Deltaproteobacteria bacterium]|nr:2-C-methyl-D-erythritol 2,4-cyclodiphosphate synthase [Deltaproteobacteria bacterium]MCF8119020.1 2-C-methyl-D-erythritol 2,4-cyclodiphosphate synthase [Deltaproteobacteria bacterium]
MFRIGFGYDVHRLKENRPLILGGVQIPHPWGLDGHSDADVLTHAVMDGVLGALGAGDIGQHFPDTDPQYKDISSLSMLKTVVGMVKESGFQVNNVDATIVAQAPRLASYLSDMEMQLAALLEVPDHAVNVKATTSERLGFCGRGEGMEAFAVISLLERNP